MLDARLRAVAALVRPGKRLADIGTDHAYLPVELVKSGYCPWAVGADLRAGPLEAARRNVVAAGLSDRISLRLGDGLAPIAVDEVEDIAIAGMGGETIVSILTAAEWVKSAHLRLILQPMTRGEELRRYLLTNGFSVETERLVQDGHHLYPVMAARYTAAPPETDAYFFYAGFFDAEEGKPYRRMMAEHLTRRAEGLRHAGDLAGGDRLAEIAARLRAAAA